MAHDSVNSQQLSAGGRRLAAAGILVFAFIADC
jgi:hypothetical protein